MSLGFKRLKHTTVEWHWANDVHKKFDKNLSLGGGRGKDMILS